MTWLPRYARGGVIPRDARYQPSTVPLHPVQPVQDGPQPVGEGIRIFVAVIALVDIPLGVAAAAVVTPWCLWITVLGAAAFAATRRRTWWTL